MAPKRRERWYSLDGQRRIHESAIQGNSGPRRLISLVFLLVLVTLLIQQVSDPKKVGRVAGAVGLLPPENADADNPVQASESAQQQQQANPADPTDLVGQAEINLAAEQLGLVSSDPSVELSAQVLEQLMKNLPEDVKSKLVERAFQIVDRTKQTAPLESDSADSIRQWLASSLHKLTRWIDLADSKSSEHASLLELQGTFQGLGNRGSEAPLTDLPIGLQRGMELSLDRTLLADLSDNTPWRTTERLALARLLVRAAELSKLFGQTIEIDAVPSIAIPQLLSQTDTLRGRCYRVQGTIGLIEPTSSMELADSRKLSYSVVWIRPDDLSDQPINIYVPQGVLASRELKVGDALQVAGLIAKRRAYASQRGGEIAPVLIATCLVLDEQPQGTPARSQRSALVAKALSRNRNLQAWTPPVDRQAPLDLVQQALAGHLGKIPLDDAESIQPERLASSPSALASLANLIKFQNEIDTVVSGGNSAMLVTEPSGASSNPKYQPLLGTWQGHIVKVRAYKIDPNALPGLDWREVFALDVATHSPMAEVGSKAPSFQVLARDIPILWRSAQEIHQPVEIQGLGFVPNLSSESAGQSFHANIPAAILASRVAWRAPTRKGELPVALDGLAPKLSVGWSGLLASGWELDLCDALERLHGQSITSKEARSFYTLLAKSKDSQETASKLTDSKGLSVMEWIRRTEAMKLAKSDDGTLKRSVGERIEARVQIRRIQRVDLRNAQHQDWLGGNHYYQLDGIADIGPSRIEVKYGKDYEPITYERDFPITLVATKLPTWILADPSTLGASGEISQDPTDLDSSSASSSIAWSTKIRVDVSGYAYRIWRFRTPQVSAVTQDTGYQQAPMMVVDTWQLARGTGSSDKAAGKTGPSIGSILTTLVGLAAIGWFAYRMNASKR